MPGFKQAYWSTTITISEGYSQPKAITQEKKSREKPYLYYALLSGNSARAPRQQDTEGKDSSVAVHTSSLLGAQRAAWQRMEITAEDRLRVPGTFSLTWKSPTLFTVSTIVRGLCSYPSLASYNLHVKPNSLTGHLCGPKQSMLPTWPCFLIWKMKKIITANFVLCLLYARQALFWEF